MSSPTSLTLKTLRDVGLACDVAEKWHRGVRKDLFGFVDVVALHPERGFLGLQVTTASSASARMRKMREERLSEVLLWLGTPGGVIELWGWRKLKRRKKDGRLGKAVFWSPKIWQVHVGERAAPGLRPIEFVPVDPTIYKEWFK